MRVKTSEKQWLEVAIFANNRWRNLGHLTVEAQVFDRDIKILDDGLWLYY